MNEKILTDYELRQRLTEIIGKGGVQAYINTELAWTNKNILKLYAILAKSKIENFIIDERILHPTKDIPPRKHTAKYQIRVVATIFEVETLVKEIQKLNRATKITRIKAGIMTFLAGDGAVYFLIKESEP